MPSILKLFIAASWFTNLSLCVGCHRNWKKLHMECYFSQRLRFYYERFKHNMKGQDFTMNSPDILWQTKISLWTVKIFMMTGQDFIMNGWDFSDDGLRFIMSGQNFSVDRLRFSWWRFNVSLWTMKIFSIASWDFHDKRSLWYCYYERSRFSRWQAKILL